MTAGVFSNASGYGTLTLNSDGSYSYALNNGNAAVNALNDGQSLTDSFTYTLTDGDGSSTTATLVITINGRTDGPPRVDIPDTDGAANATDSTLPETAGATAGSFSVSAEAGIASISVGGTTLTLAQLNNLASVPVTPINTGEGSLQITAFNAATGVVSYTYDPSVLTHSAGAAITDSIAISVTDANGVSRGDNLDIAITDSTPSAVNDVNSITEDAAPNSVTGNVLGNDSVGADANATPVTAGVFSNASGYGTLTLNSDGSYSYALNNGNAAVNALNDGQSLTDSFTYTLTDGDGSSTTATLVITINGRTDGPPRVDIPDTDGAANATDSTLPETAGATAGSFSVSAEAGIASISVGGTTLTLAQLNNLASVPVTPINTGEGSLQITAFNAATGVVSYTYDPSVLTHSAGAAITDSIAISVTDANGVTRGDNLDIAITDSTPSAVNDVNSITEDAAPNSVTGNVLGNDSVGADANATPVTAGVFSNASGYGTLTLNSDGSYSYALNNGNAAVNALNDGQSLTDSFTYTLTDGDGSSTTATLVITINGRTDGPPRVDIPDTDGAANATDSTLPETAGATAGSFSVSAEAGIASISVGGTTLTLAQLNNLASVPVTPINTGEGSLQITAFNAATGVVSYTYDPSVLTHSAGAAITDSIAISVTDANGVSRGDNLDIAITDSTPSAVNDVNSITEDATPNSVTGNVLGNDSVGADANATPVTAGVFSNASGYGTLTLNSDGSYSYALNNGNAAVNALNDGQSLTDSFTYTLTDGDGSSTTATLVITINGRTDGPPRVDIPDTDGAANATDSTLPETAGATAGSFSVSAEAGIASISVGGTTLTLAQLNNLASVPVTPINTGEGSLQITAFNAATGVVSYTYDPSVLTHSAGAAITDSIAISVTDANGVTRGDNLDIAITDSTPSAVNDVNSITEDAAPNSVTGNVLGNDSVGADANATPVTAGVFSNASGYGTLTLNSDGSYSYALNNGNAAVNALNDGQSLTDSFTYTLTDGDGSSTTATLVITINGRTDGPPRVDIPDTDGAANATDSTLPETAGATAGSFSVSAEAGIASISVGGTTLTLAQLNNLASVPVTPINTGEGSLQITAFNAATGVVSYTYDPSVLTHSAGAAITDSIAISVTDANGVSRGDNLDIAITDSTPSAVNDVNSITEDAAPNSVTGNVLGNDSVGADANATPVTAGVFSNASGYGTLTLNSDGSYSYALNNGNAAVNALNDGQSLTDSFTYTLTDGDGSSTSATLVITINGRTDGPPRVDIPDTDGAANATDSTLPETAGATAGSFSVSAEAGIASISVGGTTLTLAQLNNLASVPVTPINTGEGSLQITAFNAATGVVSYTYDPSVLTHSAGAAITDSIAISVTDANGVTRGDNLDIAITDSTPSAVNDVNSITEDATPNSVTGNVLGNDSVGADANATPVTAGVFSNASGYGTLTLNSDGSYSYALNNGNAAVNALNDGQSLTDSFTYTLTDGDGSSTTATLVITINGRTDGPPRVDIPDTDGAANATDSTLPETAGATAGSFSVSAEAGIASISVGGTTLTLAQLNNLASVPVAPINTGEGSLQITAFNAATGVVSYTYDPSVLTHSAGAAITDSIAISVTDANGVTRGDNLDIAITDSTPSAVNDVNSITEDATPNSVTGNVLGNDSVGADANATPVTAANVALSYGTLTLNSNGSYSYALNNGNTAVNALKTGQSLTDSFTYTLTDGDGDTSTATLTVTINGRTDGPPTITPEDGNGAAAGQATVNEAGLTSTTDTSETTTGTITVTAPDGLASVNIGGTILSAAQLAALSTTNTTSIDTGEGTLLLNGFNAATGALSYSYTLKAALTQTGLAESLDAVALTVTDLGGGTNSGTLGIRIVDDTPKANADTASITEDATPNTVTGNVLSNDSVGADANATPVTAGVFTNVTAYGTLTLNSDGSYSYALNNGNTAVNALKTGQSLTDSFTYTLTDGDGDTSTATLTVTINGRTDGPPTITPEDGNGAAAGQATVNEAGLTSTTDTSETTTGTITVTAPDGLASVNIGGTILSAAQLAALSTTNTTSIDTGEGTLLLNGFNAATGALSYSYTLKAALTQTGLAESLDAVALTVTDLGGGTNSGTLGIRIVDDTPKANADTASITEDATPNTVTGNVLSNDSVGADANATPVTAGVFTNVTAYGTLTLNSDGSYSYALNNGNAAVNALKTGQSLTDSFTYTLTDGDGDTSTATLDRHHQWHQRCSG